MNTSKRKIRIINLKSFISNLVFFFVLLFLIGFFFSCNNSIEPEELKPGRRDYTWTVDTVKTEFTRLMKMWGTSPSNIWAIGHGASGYDETIWHYDGDQWKSDGVWRNIEPWCIYGFSERDIWIGGADGKIWHYDGNDWSENLVYSTSEITLVHFMDIWGDSPNDVYAVGFWGGDNELNQLVLHYNGTDWERVYVGNNKSMLMSIRRGKQTSSNYFVWGIDNNHYNLTPDTTKLFEFNRIKLEEIHSDQYGIYTANYLQVISDEVIFTIGKGIYTYSNNTFNLITKNPYENYYDAVFGRSKKDIFWTMADGLTHFNGSDFEYILNFDNKSLSDGVVFENDVFFVANDFNNGTNLIYHGRLK